MQRMLPELEENSTFLRYYEIWRQKPSSVVFAPLAEILILHKCYQEAITVCKKGLDNNPDLVSGRVALARAYLGVGNLGRAKEEAARVLEVYPNHPEALKIKGFAVASLGVSVAVPAEKVGRNKFEPSSLNPRDDRRWSTSTMAEIFAAQGDLSEARRIYATILKSDPDNIRAKEGLKKIVGE